MTLAAIELVVKIGAFTVFSMIFIYRTINICGGFCLEHKQSRRSVNNNNDNNFIYAGKKKTIS